jgi:hypothetical protein
MPITALCLIRLASGAADPVSAPSAKLRIDRLADALLVHTGQDFSSEPEVLSAAVRALLGDELLDQHEDPRGLFFLPDVAAPQARSYAGVIDEVGEGGMWAPLDVEPPAALNAVGLEALLGSMLGQDPRQLLAAAAASARDNPEALSAASARLNDLFAAPDALDKQIPGLSDMLRGSGIDFESPELQRMAAGLQAELARDPKRLADFAEQLFGQARERDAQDEEDDD